MVNRVITLLFKIRQYMLIIRCIILSKNIK